MKLNKLFKLLFLLLCVISTSNCTKPQTKILKVGVSPDYPPFTFEYRDKLIGFDIDLITSIAERLKYKVVFKTMNFEDLLPALKSQSVDLIASSVSKTEKRLKEFDFSHSYYQPSFALVLKRDRLKQVHSLNNIEKHVGVESGTTMEQYLKEFTKTNNTNALTIRSDSNDPSKEITISNSSATESQENKLKTKSYKRNTDLVGVLQKDEVEGILLEVLEAEVVVQNDRSLGYIPVITAKNTDYPYGIVFLKDSKLTAEFDQILDIIESEGKIDILKLRWFSGYGIYNDVLKK